MPNPAVKLYAVCYACGEQMTNVLVLNAVNYIRLLSCMLYACGEQMANVLVLYAVIAEVA